MKSIFVFLFIVGCFNNANAQDPNEDISKNSAETNAILASVLSNAVDSLSVGILTTLAGPAQGKKDLTLTQINKLEEQTKNLYLNSKKSIELYKDSNKKYTLEIKNAGKVCSNTNVSVTPMDAIIASVNESALDKNSVPPLKKLAEASENKKTLTNDERSTLQKQETDLYLSAQATIKLYADQNVELVEQYKNILKGCPKDKRDLLFPKKTEEENLNNQEIKIKKD